MVLAKLQNRFLEQIQQQQSESNTQTNLLINQFIFQLDLNQIQHQYQQQQSISMYETDISKIIIFKYNIWKIPKHNNLMVSPFSSQEGIYRNNKNLLFLLLSLLIFSHHADCFANFGMNKPHMLFHLGDRRPVSSNIGWGYWADQQQLRLKYQNTDSNIYAAMDIHNGQNLFQQAIKDKQSKIETVIRYHLDLGSLNGSPAWEAEIKMQNKQADQATWFTYFSVENNDYRLVDHEKHTSYIYLIPQYVAKDKNAINLKCMSMLYSNQTISVIHSKQLGDFQQQAQQQNKEQQENEPKQKQKQKQEARTVSTDQIKMFGLTANISQTHTIYPIADTFKKLVRVSRKQEKLKPVKQVIDQQQKKIIQWERRQIQFIRQDDWENKNYVVIFIYGTLKKGQKSTIYLTNSTNTKFNHQAFQKKSKQIQESYKKHAQNSPQQTQSFLTHILSNLYAGLTFYYGRLYTQNSLTIHKQDYSYSFTPSRLIFPRSFLWDDGFHQSVIVHYNPHIVLDVLTNWMNKIDIFGWIGREQIRGGEISSMMPDSRFVFQDWFQMNPPTLMMSLLTLTHDTNLDQNLQQQLQLFLTNFYRKLQSWYRYFKNTQSHQSLDYQQSMNSTDRNFRWHCKDECSKGNFMGSGLDDYPRRGHESQIAKQHVDLLSWLYFFSSSLQEIGKYAQKFTFRNNKLIDDINQVISHNERNLNKYSRRVKYYKAQSSNYIHQLYDKFYDSSDSLFKDIVVVKDDLYIQKFVDKIGYINLFPFFTGMLVQQNNTLQFEKYSQQRLKSIKKCLQIMSDEKLLMSQDGLRSLSFSDPLYGTDENYWRGAVWLPINYMVLRACKLYYWNDSQLSQQIRKFYMNLRQKLIKSVHETYKNTGYLFQNYYEGRGHRGFPFYGWTATIANIITEQY